MIFLKHNSGFTGIIYKEFLLLMVTSFFIFELPNSCPQKKYMQFWLVLKNLPTRFSPFHKESLHLVATPLLSHLKCSCNNPKKVKAIKEKTCEVLLSSTFTENLLSWLNHRIKLSVHHRFLNTNLPTTETKVLTTR